LRQLKLTRQNTISINLTNSQKTVSANLPRNRK